MSELRNGVPECSGSDLWMTPPHIIKALTRKYGALFDPCPRDWDGSFDGLEIDWPNDQDNTLYTRTTIPARPENA